MVSALALSTACANPGNDGVVRAASPPSGRIATAGPEGLSGFCAICEERHEGGDRWVGPFFSDRGAAERDAHQHERRHPSHRVRIVHARPDIDE